MDGRAAEAIAMCREILAAHAGNIEATSLLAEALREARRLPEAADLLERVIASDPESVIGHWGLGLIFEERGNPSAALYELGIAIDLAPGIDDLVRDVDRLLGIVGAEWAPRESEARRAWTLWRGFQYRRALGAATRALEQDPSRLDLALLRALIFWRVGAIDEALVAANTVISDSPDCYLALAIVAFGRHQRTDVAASEGAFSRLQTLDPTGARLAPLFPDEPVPCEYGATDPDCPPLVSPESHGAETVPGTSATGTLSMPTIGSQVDAPETEASSVPAWLAADPASRAAPSVDIDLSEWADLLTADVELDPEAEARLDEAIADAASFAVTSTTWRSSRLADARLASESANGAGGPVTPVSANADSIDERALMEIARADSFDGALSVARQRMADERVNLDHLIDELKELDGLRPHYPALLQILGDAYVRTGRFQRAVETYCLVSGRAGVA